MHLGTHSIRLEAILVNCVNVRGKDGRTRFVETYGIKLGLPIVYSERYFSFALTPEEGEKLVQEPHLNGDIEDHTCCGGVNEHDLCMHPPDIWWYMEELFDS